MKRNLLLLATLISLLVTPAMVHAQVTMPPIKFRERTLTNGMRVLSAEDHSSPTVAIQVWYHVGSKDDPERRSGFAHLFEHLMFKATNNMKSEMMDRLTEDVGGFNNSLMSDDVLCVLEVVNSKYLNTFITSGHDRISV